MKHVNFLPGKVKNIYKLELNILLLILIFMILVLLSFAYMLSQKANFNKLTQRNLDLTSELAPIRAKHAELTQQAGVPKADIDPDVLKIITDPVEWAVILKDMVSYLPDSVSLTQVSSEVSTDRMLIIDAAGSNIEAVSQTKDKFAQGNLCKQVELDSLGHPSDETQKDWFSFKLKCYLR